MVGYLTIQYFVSKKLCGTDLYGPCSVEFAHEFMYAINDGENLNRLSERDWEDWCEKVSIKAHFSDEIPLMYLCAFIGDEEMMREIIAPKKLKQFVC